MSDSLLKTAHEALACCRAWHREACLIGNVRAGDLASVLETFINIYSERDDHELHQELADALSSKLQLLNVIAGLMHGEPISGDYMEGETHG